MNNRLTSSPPITTTALARAVAVAVAPRPFLSAELQRNVHQVPPPSPLHILVHLRLAKPNEHNIRRHGRDDRVGHILHIYRSLHHALRHAGVLLEEEGLRQYTRVGARDDFARRAVLLVLLLHVRQRRTRHWVDVRLVREGPGLLQRRHEEHVLAR